MSNESTTHAPVRPVRPVAPYVGCKRNLSRKLVDMIEATPHTVYAEPFVGMGGVFFRRASRPKAEIINDWSGDVANLFRCMRAHPGALNDLIALQLHCRADFDLAMQQEADSFELWRLMASGYSKLGNQGMTSLARAEMATLRGQRAEAKAHAEAAARQLTPGTPAWQRAQDLKAYINSRPRK